MIITSQIRLWCTHTHTRTLGPGLMRATGENTTKKKRQNCQLRVHIHLHSTQCHGNWLPHTFLVRKIKSDYYNNKNETNEQQWRKDNSETEISMDLPS